MAAGVVVGGPAAVAIVGYGAAGIGAAGLVAYLQSLGTTMGLAGFAMTPAGKALIAVGCLIP
jgi:hypothetical protein